MPVFAQGLRQSLPVDRLREVLRSPQRVAEVFVLHNGDKDNRNGRQRRIRLQRPQHRPAVLARHQNIQRNHTGLQFPGELESFLAARGHHHLEALLAQKACQEITGRGVIVDDQHAIGFTLRMRESDKATLPDHHACLLRPRRRNGYLGRHPHGEPGPLASVTLRADGPAHELAEPLGDGQPQTGATMLARRRAVNLHEGFKHPRQLVAAHADSGIAHGKLDPILFVSRNALRSQGDGATLCELAGVREKVEEHLAHPREIGPHVAKAGVALELEDVTIFPHEGSDRGHQIVEHLADVKALEPKLHLAGFDFREIQDAVDQREEMLPGTLDLSEVRDEEFFEFLFSQILDLLLEHLAVTDDGVQRRPQLVAHVGEKAAFRLVGLIGVAACLTSIVESPGQLLVLRLQRLAGLLLLPEHAVAQDL